MVILKRKLSVRGIAQILNTKKKTKKIICSEGTFNQLPKRALRALREMKIKIEVVKLQRGQKPTVDVKKIARLSNLPAKKIAKKTRIPLRTVYYHLKKMRKKQ